jgi:hypothetical protein
LPQQFFSWLCLGLRAGSGNAPFLAGSCDAYGGKLRTYTIVKLSGGAKVYYILMQNLGFSSYYKSYITVNIYKTL